MSTVTSLSWPVWSLINYGAEKRPDALETSFEDRVMTMEKHCGMNWERRKKDWFLNWPVFPNYFVRALEHN